MTKCEGLANWRGLAPQPQAWQSRRKIGEVLGGHILGATIGEGKESKRLGLSLRGEREK
jgi:hypothetical protein